MESLYRVFKNEEALNEFNDFYHEVQQRFALSAQTGILLARSFIDLKQYDQARRIIEELNTDDPTAEAYYWLARIAENASRLGPDGTRYSTGNGIGTGEQPLPPDIFQIAKKNEEV